MRKMLICGLLMLSALVTIAQPADGSDKKMMQALSAFSAATLYNTYGLIGSIGDGFGSDVYDAETARNLLNAQKDLMDNLVKLTEDLTLSGTVKDSASLVYLRTATGIMKDLKEQARLMTEYTKDKKRKILDAYEKQRNENWKSISRLMGVPE